MHSNTDHQCDLLIVYDGECIFCQNYVQLQKLRENVGSVKLVDARQQDDIVRALSNIGLDINAGMAALYQDKWYFGAECMTLLSNLSDRQSVRGRIWYILFHNKTLTKYLYPLLRGIRNLTLKIRGVSKIKPDMKD